MATKIQLLPGVYYAGMNRPWYVSQGMVESAMEEAGFRQIKWHSRKSSPPPVNPREYPRYSDDWDEWISTTFSAAKTVELPAMPAWIVAQAASQPSPVGPGPVPGPSPSPSPFPGRGPGPGPSPFPSIPSSSLASSLSPGAQEVLNDPSTQRILRVAGPAMLVAEVSLVVFLGMYAKYRATARVRERSSKNR